MFIRRISKNNNFLLLLFRYSWQPFVVVCTERNFHFFFLFSSFFVFTILCGAFNLRLAAVLVFGICLFHCVRMNFDISYFIFFLWRRRRHSFARPPPDALHMRCEASKYAFFFNFVSVEFLSSESNTVSLSHEFMIIIGPEK